VLDELRAISSSTGRQPSRKEKAAGHRDDHLPCSFRASIAVRNEFRPSSARWCFYEQCSSPAGAGDHFPAERTQHFRQFSGGVLLGSRTGSLALELVVEGDALLLLSPKEKRPWLAYASSTARAPSPGTDERGRQKYCIAGGKGLRHSLSQRLQVKISLSGNTRADDARREGAHEASDPKGAVGIVRAQVRLHAKGRHVDGACSVKEQRQPRSDHRICPGGPERFVDPIADRRDELHGRLGSHGTAIEVDRENMATRSQSCDVMSENLASVGKVKEDQATDDRIKWLGIPKCPHVCLKERDVC
jgi:hypothetical protein